MSEPSLVPLPELDDRGRGAFTHEGRRYAVFTVDGAPVVVDDACPHRGGPLSEGLVRERSVVCPWHWYRYDLVTGACRNATAEALRLHPVVEVDGRSQVRLTPPGPGSRSVASLLRSMAMGQPAPER